MRRASVGLLLTKFVTLYLTSFVNHSSTPLLVPALSTFPLEKAAIFA
jgi:hypothetical protein